MPAYIYFFLLKNNYKPCRRLNRTELTFKQTSPQTYQIRKITEKSKAKSRMQRWAEARRKCIFHQEQRKVTKELTITIYKCSALKGSNQ